MRAPRTAPENLWIDLIRNNYASANLSFEEYGWWDEAVFEVVPLAMIKHRETWSADKAEKNYELLKMNGMMPPVVLGYIEEEKKYVISNGIHRIAAARRLGYDAVPAIVHHARTTPPPYDPDTDMKRSESHAWSLIRKTRDLVQHPLDADVKNSVPGKFQLKFERFQDDPVRHFMVDVNYEGLRFNASVSGAASGNASGSMEEVAAGIARLIEGPVMAWIRANCRFAKVN